MISVEELRNHLIRNAWKPSAEVVSLADSFGRALAHDYATDRNLPPFDRVTMDGIAISAVSYQQGIRSFRCENKQFAGSQQIRHSGRLDTCIEVATGAALPLGCDAILPYEWLDKEDDAFRVVQTAEVHPGMNIHAEGSDLLAGSGILKKGEMIDQHAMAIMASIGVALPEVFSLPRTAIISTGDELVDVEQLPLPHQIRRSNDLVIAGLLAPLGLQPERVHLHDSKEQLCEWLRGHLNRFDLLIFSGGVSMGKKDYTPEALASVGIDAIFHKVSQRPGKPLWFGKNERTTVFGLPGNPVSAAVSTAVHIRYWLTCNYVNKAEASVVLDEEVTFKPKLTRWMPVHVRHDKGVLRATPVRGNNSGDFISLHGTTGLIEMPAEQELFERGSVYEYIEW